jgi:exosortase
MTDQKHMNIDVTALVMADLSERRQYLVSFLVIGIISLLLYASVALKLVHDWWDNPNYSHGFFVPLFAGFVVWQKRETISKIPMRPSWGGLAVCAVSSLLLIVGTLGAELFLARISLLLQMAGLIVLFWGAETFSALLFPWALLGLAIPIPAIIFNQVALPLQLFASDVAASLLSCFGVPVLQDGNIIRLPSTTLEVVTACSGIRSLVSLITLAAFYGYMKRRTIGQRWGLVALSIPIAIGANSLRVMGTGLLAQYWSPDKAEGFFHTFAGLMVFLLSMLLLILSDSLLCKLLKQSHPTT